MKSIIPVVALLCIGSPLQAQDKNALRKITAVYESIEESFDSWPTYSMSAQNMEGGHSFHNHLWVSDGDEHLSK
jgi:hypothetical protein